MPEDLTSYPGGVEVAKGLDDLRQNRLTEETLLVALASPRLRELGLFIPELPPRNGLYEHALFTMLKERLPKGAHAAYNALIARVVSFVNAYARSQAVSTSLQDVNRSRGMHSCPRGAIVWPVTYGPELNCSGPS